MGPGSIILLVQSGGSGQAGTGQWLIAIGVFAIVLVFGVIVLWTGVGARTMEQSQKSWLDYGNFYIVAWGISAVVLGFLATLLFLDAFSSDMSQALGFMSAFFGAIVGLVGTYFGVKSSADAREGAEKVALSSGNGSTTPTITVMPKNETAALKATHTVTSVATSADGSPASGVLMAFRITSGPDSPRAKTETTDASGHATFDFTNGKAGTDTIEATCLKGTGTSTVKFMRWPGATLRSRI